VSAQPAQTLPDRLELAELLAEKTRRNAYDSLLSYCQYVAPPIEPFFTPPHIHEVADHLEAIERGDIDRLIVVLPVRHGKSTLCSKRFPLWFMGRNAGTQIVHAAYGGQLVTDFGNELRRLMRYTSPHLNVFPDCTLSADTKAKGRWNSGNGGIYNAAGIGGAITGYGAHLAIIDDPIKGRKAADSETERENAWSWYQNDFYTRLQPNARIVAIGSRWHDDDPIGRLLEQDDDWVVVHQKALSDDGKALWPSMYPVPALERIKRIVGPRAWQALYQGEPTLETGSYFDRDDIHLGDPPPVEEMTIYGASDYAITFERSDYTVHMVVGIDRWDRMWVLDIWREQAASDRWALALMVLMKQWEPVVWLEERGVIAKSVGPLIDRMQRELSVYCRREGFVSASDKATRSRSIQGYIRLHGLHLPKDAPWVPQLLHEMMAFPLGKNDDQVDCLSLIGRLLHNLKAGEEQTFETKISPEMRRMLDPTVAEPRDDDWKDW